MAGAPVTEANMATIARAFNTRADDRARNRPVLPAPVDRFSGPREVTSMGSIVIASPGEYLSC